MDPLFKRTNIDPGGFAEFIRVPALHVEHTLCPLPATLPDLATAVFIEAAGLLSACPEPG
jgi:L-iditol 2-dehydrogenase